MTLRIKTYPFTYVYCEQGHMLYSESGSISESRCRTCGTGFVRNCANCNNPLQNSFRSPVYLGQGTPTQRPKRPAHCPHCGIAFPWTLHEQSIAAATAGTNALTIVRQICSRFHLVVRQLRNRHAQRSTLDVTDEYDVQDLFHSLLSLYFDDIRAEEVTPSYAGKSSRIDFLVNVESLGIEVKMTRGGLDSRELGTQLIDDIARYRKHPECKTLVCFVYDPDGRISNPIGIMNDLSSKSEGFTVEVIVVPRGY